MARSGELSSTRSRSSHVGAGRSAPIGAERAHAAADLDAELAQQHLGEGAGRHPRRGLARRGALEHVAQVAAQVLDAAGEVGVARAAARCSRRSSACARVDRRGVHHALPVRVVAVGDPQRDGEPSVSPPRTPPRTSTASCLDLHAPAAAVAVLAAAQVAGEQLEVDAQPGGQALEHGGEAGAVAFAGGGEESRRTRRKISRQAPISTTSRACGL